MIDLRSDTITKPTAGMRSAMAGAEVGDDQFGEDPTVNLLQERVADLLGKEASLFFPTGTMANQCAIRTLTRPGDDVIVSKESHVVIHETGAAAANSGVQFTEIGSGGMFTAEEFVSAYKAPGHIVHPPTTLVAVENTHNRAGGVIFPLDEALRIGQAARERNVFSYCDGARLWNAALATGREFAQLAEPFDLVSVAFSKGLGCPAGSMLAGSRDIINRAIRYRRMLGGAMRQTGILAAACMYALDNHLEQLHNDHHNARKLAETLSSSPLVSLDMNSVQTNIVIFDLNPEARDAETLVSRAERLGVSFFAFGPRTIRLVTHRDVRPADCETAARLILKAIEQ
ncbi:aminotransferase class I/II-fold pyridoxal phosphate-dependent enzyme [bacterium]|nr:aminotransferase class I/II-fold pyridoxal phosphate-dependent enzyme [bacterium]